MNTDKYECCRCVEVRNELSKKYPNAKFDMFYMSGQLNRIISSNAYIILTWLGDNCCGDTEEGHSEPKTYVVHRENKFITVHDVIKALIEYDFQVPCDFNSLMDIVPLINPLKSLDSSIVFELDMRHLHNHFDYYLY